MKTDWKEALNQINLATDATHLRVLPMDGERLMVFNNGSALRVSDRGKVLEFLNREEAEQLHANRSRG